jgi:predicted nucleic acid-binding protein
VIVVDASALIELLLRTPRAQAVADRLLTAEQSLHAPHLVDVEIAQVLRRYLRVGALSAARAKQALDDLSALPMDRHPHTDLLSRIWQLRDALTAYDAAYVALAEALRAPLLTCDGKLARAHGHKAQIELV